ncbi:MAG: TonB family protein [Pseudomonadota bacterium]
MKILSIGAVPMSALTLIVCILLLVGCAPPAPLVKPVQPGEAPLAGALANIDRVETTGDGTSTSRTVDDYKRDLALRITQVNSTHIYPDRPQALLRSVVVLKFVVDAEGKLLRSEIVRSNRDRVTEATALKTLRATAPFPKPAAMLLRNGRLEVSETWLFNNDGRFQIRSVALPQMDR